MPEYKSLRDIAKPGDLLFYKVTPASSFIARLIAIFQLWRKEGSGPVQYSHVAILERDKDSRIEARWPAVRVSAVNWSDPELEVWRCPMGGTDSALVLINARNRIGDMYDIGQLLFGMSSSGHAEICTTLVQKSFEESGIKLGAGAGKLLTPNELVADPALKLIGRVCDDQR